MATIERPQQQAVIEDELHLDLDEMIVVFLDACVRPLRRELPASLDTYTALRLEVAADAMRREAALLCKTIDRIREGT